MNTNEDTPEAKGKAMGKEFAFPVFDDGGPDARLIEGMTKREVIAKDLMTGLLSNPAMIDTYGGQALEEIAKASVRAADALLVVLNE